MPGPVGTRLKVSEMPLLRSDRFYRWLSISAERVSLMPSTAHNEG